MQQAMGWDKRMLQSRAEPLCTPQLGYRGGRGAKWRNAARNWGAEQPEVA